MKKIIALTAIVPLALLAGCGDNDVADSSETTEMAATEDVGVAEPDAATPGPASKLAESGDFSGTYSMAGADGKKTSVMLDSSNDTYEYTDAAGKKRTGSYIRLDDGYRIRLDDFNGGPSFFTLSNGYLMRMQDDAEVDEKTVVTGERYQRDDGAMFSREPEIGSPVAPQ